MDTARIRSHCIDPIPACAGMDKVKNRRAGGRATLLSALCALLSNKKTTSPLRGHPSTGGELSLRRGRAVFHTDDTPVLRTTPTRAPQNRQILWVVLPEGN